MKGAARPWAAVAKPGSHGTERGGKGLPATTGGMRPSKSSTSLAFESRLSKLKRASSEDMLSKPGVVTPSGGSRLKKTITAGAISELAENRLRPSTGPPLSAKRTGIPAPRELPGAVAREKAVLRTRKAQPSPTSSGAPTPTKHSRPSLKPKNEAEVGDKAGLASQVKGLLAEAKTKDSEIVKLRHELKKHQDLSGLVDLPVDGLPAEVKSLIQDLQEKNKTFQRELLSLGEENRLLKEKLSQQEHSPLSDTSSSLPTPTTQESSFGSPTQPSLGSHPTGGSPCLNGPPLRNSGSSSSDVTKASLSPDASDFEHIVDVPSRPPSTGSNVFKSSRCSTSGSSPNNVSDLSVASLTERIQRMEENHHCTAEELQATLQELSDQQQVVQELTAENEKLAEEKAMLERSFCQHRERAEQLSQENEKLSALLQDRQKTDESKGKVHELELRCAELQEKAQFEREKMLNIQQQLTSSLRGLEREHHEAQGALKSLGEEAKRLGGLLETERQNNATLARTLEECKVHLEGLKIESQSLRSQLDSEKRKAAAMDAMEQAAGRSDAHELLRGIRAERDQLERSCTELRQELLKAQSEVKTLQGQLAKVEQEGVQLQARCAGQAEELSQTGQELEERRSEGEAELRSLKEALFQLEDQVEQQRVVRLHDQQIIGQMEDNLLKLEDQKLELERQLKMLNKQIKEDTEEWRRFQADLQTAVVVANDIKCEVQQELRAVKRRLLEEEEKTARLQKELEEVEGGSRSQILVN